MTLSRQLADMVMQTPEIDNKDVIKAAKCGVIDFFAASLHAINEKETTKIKQWIIDEGGTPKAWLLGHKTKATASQAALLNGFQAHLLDIDDVHADVRGHPSAVILSALFASIDLTSADKIDGRRFLTAYVIGIEIMARLGQALNPSHYIRGWHSTATLGGIAAVAAICYLHRYDFLRQAFALAATQAAGLRLMFGTPVKPLHAGLAAQTAIRSIALLQNGLTADCDFLDPQKGFIAVYGEKGSELLLDNWGREWKINNPGLWFKSYSYCSAAAYVADAANLLFKQHQFELQQIERIDLIFSPQGDSALIYPRPKFNRQGRFSAEYIAVKSLLGEPLDFTVFDDEPVLPHITVLIEKCKRSYYEEKQSQRFAVVKVRLKNGEFFQQRIEHPQGSPKNPYSDQALYHKLAEAVKDEELAHQLFEDIYDFPDHEIKTFINKYLIRL